MFLFNLLTLSYKSYFILQYFPGSSEKEIKTLFCCTYPPVAIESSQSLPNCSHNLALYCTNCNQTMKNHLLKNPLVPDLACHWSHSDSHFFLPSEGNTKHQRIHAKRIIRCTRMLPTLLKCPPLQVKSYYLIWNEDAKYGKILTKKGPIRMAIECLWLGTISLIVAPRKSAVHT